jgi:hypothetical protein
LKTEITNKQKIPHKSVGVDRVPLHRNEGKAMSRNPISKKTTYEFTKRMGIFSSK